MSDSDSPNVVSGDPLLGRSVNVHQFGIEISAQSHVYSAASHRQVIRSIRVTNGSWQGDADEIIVRVFAEAVGTRDLVIPWAKSFRPVLVGGMFTVDTLSIKPNLLELASLDEAVIGDVVVQVVVNDQVLGEERHTVDFLAYNQWFFNASDFECLSSFVLPNHPVVSQVMEGVRRRLAAADSVMGGSTMGYQLFSNSPKAGRAHVLDIMQAIYEELQSLGLEYTNPPASFEGYGQKVRTPDVIMRDKAATCLDSTVLVASCAAAAGLSPLLFVVEGHAFPGVWATPETRIGDDGSLVATSIRPGIIDNPNEFQAMCARGMFVSMESTMICGAKKTPFNDAFNRHADFEAGGGILEFEAVVDVERCSQLGVRRLPNRDRGPGGTVVKLDEEREFEVQRPDSVEGALGPLESDAGREKLPNNVPRRVRKWMDALLDIDNSNPLISLMSTPVMMPLEAKKKSSRSIALPMVPGLLAEVENLLVNGGTMRMLCAHRMPANVLSNPSTENVMRHFIDNSELSIGDLPNALRLIEGLARSFQDDDGQAPAPATARAQFLFERVHEAETTRRFKALKKLADDTEASSATNQLHLTVGTLIWESPGKSGRAPATVKSPLFVIPIRLSGTAQTSFTLKMDEGGDITPNYCLLEKLRIELGLTIPELEHPNIDESGIDVNDTIERVRRRLSQSRYSSIRIEEECQLAVLDFATFRMWKDVNANWEVFKKNIVVNHLIEGGNATLVEELPQFPGEVLTPFDCDESQLEAVRWALDGRSFVLEGPPGTGKSQTIANMISAAMGQGKRVLFVAEKQVALEAVSKKLAKIGLDPFCITMHHESTTPESIRQQLRVSLEFIGEDRSAEWRSESAIVHSLQDRLYGYWKSMTLPNSVGQNALAANQEVTRLGEGPALPVDTRQLESIGRHFNEINSALLNLRFEAGESRVSVDPAWALVGPVPDGVLDKEKITALVGEITSLLGSTSRLHSLLEPMLTDGGRRMPAEVADAMHLYSSGNGLAAATIREIMDASWMSRFDDLARMAEAHKASHRQVIDFFLPTAFTVDLGPQMVAASEALEANMLKKKKKTETLRSVIRPLARAEVTKEPADLLALLQQVAPARESLAAIRAGYGTLTHINIPVDFDPLDPAQVQNLRKQAEETRSRAELLCRESVLPVRSLVESGTSIASGDAAALDRLVFVWGELISALGATAPRLTHWAAGKGIFAALRDSVLIWGTALPGLEPAQKIVRLERALAPLRAAGLDGLVDDIIGGRHALDEIHREFERGVALASLRENLSDGEIQTFDRPLLDKLASDYCRHDRDRKELMKSVIPRQLAESRPFARGVRTGRIGELERELGRKVRRVSVPKLIREHGEVITRLTPCFLMSPEAVSRLLPPVTDLFDIVIFDEASQIRVAAAIPSMGRARSVIVVGDSQQMPPSKRVGLRTGGGNESVDLDDDVLDLESILTECTESHVPSLTLKCHFRSQHEGLIAFSNRNFYESNLVTFPAPNSDQNTPVTWVEVSNGQFLRSGEGKGTNPQEAEAIVNEIQHRLEGAEHGSKSIGVVTFNESQAELIYQMLNDRAASSPQLLTALTTDDRERRLFVVPLERVQGDERDTIFLSVSYSYQGGDRTTVSPTWGPLTNKGGERRLNVAITRAKRDMLIYCSFNPDHVNKESAEKKGLRGVPCTVEFLRECRDAARSSGATQQLRDVSGRDHQRRKLRDEIKNAGIEVRENVGLSKFRVDLAVSDDEGNQFLAVLMDTQEWASRTTTYDREVLPNATMRLIGWRRVGRVWLKSLVEDPHHVLASVQKEVERERFRQRLVGLLGERGFVVRDDKELSAIGLDMAIKRDGQAVWPLAIRLNGPGLFPQYLPFDGEIPPEAMLHEVRCVRGLSLWTPDVADDIEGMFERIDRELAIAERDLKEFETPATTATVEAVVEDAMADVPRTPVTKKQADGPVLRASEEWSELTAGSGLPALGGKEALGPGQGENPALVRRAVDEIVALEGPITEERLASLVVARFGMVRLKGARLQALLPMFSHVQKTVSQFGTVYWNTDRQPDVWTGFRTSDSLDVRSFEDVPAEEISNAMVALVRMGNSAFAEEITRAVLGAYGIQKLGANIKSRLEAILAWTVGQGRLAQDREEYRIP